MRELVKAIRDRFLAAPTRQAACAALPKLSDADMKSVTESWPPVYDRMLGDKSATNEDGTQWSGSLSLFHRARRYS